MGCAKIAPQHPGRRSRFSSTSALRTRRAFANPEAISDERLAHRPNRRSLKKGANGGAVWPVTVELAEQGYVGPSGPVSLGKRRADGGG